MACVSKHLQSVLQEGGVVLDDIFPHCCTCHLVNSHATQFPLWTLRPKVTQ